MIAYQKESTVVEFTTMDSAENPEPEQFNVTDVSYAICKRLQKTVGPPSSLQEFLETVPELGVEDRLRILDQALLLFRQVYVHRPLKEAQLAAQPVRRLELMRLELERRRRRADRNGEMVPAEELPQPIYFHRELTEIFTSVRDRHTRYLLPRPFRGSWATLGFEIEAYHDKTATREFNLRQPGGPGVDRDYIVTRVVERGLDGGRFKPGVKVVSWNGAPIENAVEHNGDLHPGSNTAARHAQGLHRLTLRPLWTSPMPQQDWVILGYETLDGELRYIRFTWWVIPAPDGDWDQRFNIVGFARPPRWLRLELAISRDEESTALQRVRYLNVRKKVYCYPTKGETYPDYGEETERLTMEEVYLDALADRKEAEERHPHWGKAYRVYDAARGNHYGYLRLYTFEVNVPRFLEQVRELLHKLSGTRGLIVDVRDNGGGQIAAGERLLQMLTTRTIESMRFEMLVSPFNLDLCERIKKFDRLGAWEKWRDSIERGAEIGALFSTGHPITDLWGSPRERGVYRGRVVLVVNARSYSTTDILAAGFKDHGIGPILATDDNIGAGGANTVSHEVLRWVGGGRLGLRPLPEGASMQVALRRAVRVGPSAGTPLEALGIQLDEGRGDERYHLKKQDLLNQNQGLLAKAVDMLHGYR